MRLLASLVVLLAAGRAGADGVVQVRAAYYKERSTRVQQPMIDASFDAGAGKVDAHFLIDSITSASAATGAGGVEFNELRYEGALGYSHELPGRVRIGAEGKYSTETDYFSTWLAAKAELSLFSQNTTLRLLVGHAFDRITNQIAIDTGAIGTPFREEKLDTTLVSLGVNQLLHPGLVARVTYDFMWLEGYQANVYRVVRGGAEPVDERVPRRRVRHALSTGLRAWLPTDTVAIFDYRLYLDDWGIFAHTMDIRAVQEITPGLDVRARYRFYTQTDANFYSDVYTQEQISNQNEFVTSDAKLAAFVTHTLGGQVSAALLLVGVAGTWGEARIELKVDRVWQTSVFGNAWVAEVGMSVPFSY